MHLLIVKMKAHCESIHQVVGRSSQLLQDLLASPTGWQQRGSEASSDLSGLDLGHQSSSGKHISQKLIELIGDLSSLSLQAGEIYVDTRRKDKEAVKCIEHLRILVQKQQEEILKLSKPAPVLVEMATDTFDMVQMDRLMMVSYPDLLLCHILSPD